MDDVPISGSFNNGGNRPTGGNQGSSEGSSKYDNNIGFMNDDLTGLDYSLSSDNLQLGLGTRDLDGVTITDSVSDDLTGLGEVSYWTDAASADEDSISPYIQPAVAPMAGLHKDPYAFRVTYRDDWQGAAQAGADSINPYIQPAVAPMAGLHKDPYAFRVTYRDDWQGAAQAGADSINHYIQPAVAPMAGPPMADPYAFRVTYRDDFGSDAHYNVRPQWARWSLPEFAIPIQRRTFPTGQTPLIEFSAAQSVQPPTLTDDQRRLIQQEYLTLDYDSLFTVLNSQSVGEDPPRIPYRFDPESREEISLVSDMLKLSVDDEEKKNDILCAIINRHLDGAVVLQAVDLQPLMDVNAICTTINGANESAFVRYLSSLGLTGLPEYYQDKINTAGPIVVTPPENIVIRPQLTIQSVKPVINQDNNQDDWRSGGEVYDPVTGLWIEDNTNSDTIDQITFAGGGTTIDILDFPHPYTKQQLENTDVPGYTRELNTDYDPNSGAREDCGGYSTINEAVEVCNSNSRSCLGFSLWDRSDTPGSNYKVHCIKKTFNPEDPTANRKETPDDHIFYRKNR